MLSDNHFTGLKGGILVGFFALQSVSVVVGAMPDHAGVELPTLFHIVSDPYLAFTGQSQSWNLFSPNPPQISLEHFVHVQNNEETFTIAFTPDDLSWFRRTATLKFLRNFAQEGEEFREARKHFLQSLCTRHSFLSGTKLSLSVRAIDIHNPHNIDQWNDPPSSCP